MSDKLNIIEESDVIDIDQKIEDLRDYLIENNQLNDRWENYISYLDSISYYTDELEDKLKKKKKKIIRGEETNALDYEIESLFSGFEDAKSGALEKKMKVEDDELENRVKIICNAVEETYLRLANDRDYRMPEEKDGEIVITDLSKEEENYSGKAYL